MDFFFWGKLDYTDYFIRVFTGMAFTASIKTYTTLAKTLQSWRFIDLQERNSGPSLRWCYTGNGFIHTMFYFKFIYGTKENWRSQTSYRSKTAQLSCTVQPLQDGGIRSDKISCKARRLYGFYRSQPSFLSYSIGCITKKVFCLRFSRQALLLQVFAFQINNKFQNIYESTETDNKDGKKPGDTGNCLSR